MDGLRLNVLFHSISVTSGRWLVGYERLCVVEPHLRLEKLKAELFVFVLAKHSAETENTSH